MAAAQNMVQTLLGTDNRTKGKKAETTIHHCQAATDTLSLSLHLNATVSVPNDPCFPRNNACDEDDGEESLNDHDDGGMKENFREQDIYLPIANVARIMKNGIPQTGKVTMVCVCVCV